MEKEEVFEIEEKHNKRNTRKIKYIIKEGCWINISHTKDKDGYGVIKRNYKKMRLHRYIASLFLEQPPNHDELVVMHLCNNKECINPDHLSYGTQKQNSIDAIRDGLTPIGSEKKNSKLNEINVQEIKRMLSYSGIPIYEIANIFKVNKSTIVDINQKRTWNHVMPDLPLRENKAYSEEINEGIKKLLISGDYKQKEIAEIFNVSTSKVSEVNVRMVQSL